MQTTHIAVAGFNVVADRFDGGSQKQVLLLHGLGGNRITWRAAAPLIAERLQATVWAIDWPGFGATRSGTARLSLDLLERVTAGFMAQVGRPGQGWVIAGNSLGGLCALRIAVHRPQEVERVVLAASALPLSWGRRVKEWVVLLRLGLLVLPGLGRWLMKRYVLQVGVPRVVDDPIALLFGDPSRLDPQIREELIELAAERQAWAAEAGRAVEQTTRSLALALLLSGRTGAAVRGVRCPVVAISGDRDPLFPPGVWERLRQIRPDWDHRCLRDAGHVPQLEMPEEFARQMIP